MNRNAEYRARFQGMGRRKKDTAQTNWWARACAALVLSAATAIALPAQTFTTLHSFDGTDGGSSYASLLQGTDGNLYGTTWAGGAYDAGTVFKITPSGTLTRLYSFCSQKDCTDGEDPAASLVQGANGNFYGTTPYGGADGYGTVFEITPSGTLTTLYSFCSLSKCADGGYSYAALVLGTDGNFYGTTNWGGADGYGTVLRITPGGTLTTLHSFDSTDGAYSYAALVLGTDGNFYGTTSCGGTYDPKCVHDYGTVFKITPSGEFPFTTLHSFDYTDGAESFAPLVQALNGNFYGTTSQGGAHGYGTVFEITPSGTLTTLHSFDLTDGGYSSAGLVQATDGNFYGTTACGGAYDPNCVYYYGTVFKITSSGTLTTLHNFDGTDGGDSDQALVQDTNGNFYGTTPSGGANRWGTVFSLSVGLGPFVITEPTSGPVGTAVRILGTNLEYVLLVTFNGTPAKFTLVSPTEITTTVPAGATTGEVKVLELVAVDGHFETLSSNVPFRVP